MLLNFAQKMSSKLDSVIETAKTCLKVTLVAVSDSPFRADITNIKGERAYHVKIADNSYIIGADTLATIVLDSSAVFETPSTIKINGTSVKDSEFLASPLYSALSQAFARQSAKRQKKTAASKK